ncbi:hypothetical protein HK101_010048 [Irineochytrium annulatum]|nr:hypothetical protein HK101_010048 [Irineochytrium annulatum]
MASGTVFRSGSVSHASFRSVVTSDGHDDGFTRKLQRVVRDCNIAPETASIFPIFLEETAAIKGLTAEKRANVLQSMIGVVIFSRPIADYDGEAFKLMMVNPSLKHIKLNGLLKTDATTLIINCLRVPDLHGIDESLMNSIMNILGGTASPLLLSTMVSSQREFILESSEIRGGVLYMKDIAVKNLKMDITSGIQTQFDSLDRQSKMFFRYAASLGQYFDVGLIVQVFDLNVPFADIESWIEAHDIFAFLTVAVTDKGERSYFFRHISILNCIYEGISFADRRSVHLKVAKHLEEKISQSKPMADNGVESDLLPLVAYHYGLTGEFEKIVKYYDALSLVYSRKFMVLECIKTLEFLLATVKSRQADLANTAPIDASGGMPSEIEIVRWKRLLAENYRFFGHHIKCLPLFRDILKTFGVTFPDGLRECRREHHKQIWRQLWLWHKSAACTRDIMKSGAKPDSEIAALTMATLSTLLIVLITAIQTAASDPISMAHACGCLGFLVGESMPKLGLLYLKRHARLRARLLPQQLGANFYSDFLVALTQLARGNIKEARAVMGTVRMVSRVNHQILYAFVGQVCQVEFMLSRGGSLNEIGDGIVEALAASEDFKRGSNHYPLATAVKTKRR